MRGLETITALLRNRREATNVDVEMYFADSKKFIKKLQTIDPTQYDSRLVQGHHQALKGQQSSFSASFPDYKHIMEWAVNFCEYA